MAKTAVLFNGGRVEAKPPGVYMGKATAAKVVMKSFVDQYGNVRPDVFLEFVEAIKDGSNDDFITYVESLAAIS